MTTLQGIVARAMHDPRPEERLRALLAAAGDELTPDERAALAGIDPDGLRLASLIVRKLRHERVLAGDPEASPSDARDYCLAVPPTARFPSEEARAWRRHRSR